MKSEYIKSGIVYVIFISLIYLLFFILGADKIDNFTNFTIYSTILIGISLPIGLSLPKLMKISNLRYVKQLNQLRELIEFTERKCYNCHKPLDIPDFYRVNRHLGPEGVANLWNNRILEFYCCDCILYQEDKLQFVSYNRDFDN